MTAQNEWKICYKKYRELPEYVTIIQAIEADKLVEIMDNLRRSAALERQLAAAQRRIAELEIETEMAGMRIAELEGYIDQHNQRVISDHDARLLEQWHERM